MKKRAANVDLSLNRAFDAVDRFVSSPTPNEPIGEIDLDAVRLAAAKAKQVLQASSDDDLIEGVNSILATLGFPEIEHQIASRGILVVKLQGLELVSSLHEVKNQARIAGYRDPDAANIDLSNSVTKSFLIEIDESLKEVSELTHRLEAQLKANKQTGITIGFAGVSVDIGVAIDFLKSTTANAREYLEAKTRINAEALRTKLRTVSTASLSLMDAIRLKANEFSKRATDLTVKIAAAATAGYRNSLKLIKASLSKPKDDFTSNIEELASSSEMPQPFWIDPAKPLPVHTVMSVFITKFENLQRANRIPKKYLENGMLSSCELFASHGRYYLSLYFQMRRTSWRDKPTDSEPIAVTAGITKQEFDVLSGLSPDEISNMARMAFDARKEKRISDD